MTELGWSIEPRDGEPCLVVPLSALTVVDRRWLQDLVDEATAAYWLGRAEVFEDAAPRESDFVGVADDPEGRLREATIRCRVEADRCRRVAAGLSGDVPRGFLAPAG